MTCEKELTISESTSNHHISTEFLHGTEFFICVIVVNAVIRCVIYFVFLLDALSSYLIFQLCLRHLGFSKKILIPQKHPEKQIVPMAVDDKFDWIWLNDPVFSMHKMKIETI